MMFGYSSISIHQKLLSFSKYLTLDIQEPLPGEEEPFILHWHPIVSCAVDGRHSSSCWVRPCSSEFHCGQINAVVLWEKKNNRNICWCLLFNLWFSLNVHITSCLGSSGQDELPSKHALHHSSYLIQLSGHLNLHRTFWLTETQKLPLIRGYSKYHDTYVPLPSLFSGCQSSQKPN